MCQQDYQRVLIVEDNQDARDSLADLLDAYGYQSHGVANGQEALDHLHREPPPCLILLDLTMPVMNGWEFLSQRQQERALADIPVAVVSALSTMENRIQRPDAMGVVAWFSKPTNIDLLMETVVRYCS